jgi:hypothetical protein
MIKWIVIALATLGLAVLMYAVASTLLPPMAEAQRKGTFVPWVLTWAMVWESIMMAIGVAGFLVATALGKVGSTRHHVAAGRS